jgi:hypothetical protein
VVAVVQDHDSPERPSDKPHTAFFAMIRKDNIAIRRTPTASEAIMLLLATPPAQEQFACCEK